MDVAVYMKIIDLQRYGKVSKNDCWLSLVFVAGYMRPVVNRHNSPAYVNMRCV